MLRAEDSGGCGGKFQAGFGNLPTCLNFTNFELCSAVSAPWLPLGVIRSLAYFSPVIEEVLGIKVGPEYFRHLRQRLARLTEAV